MASALEDEMRKLHAGLMASVALAMLIGTVTPMAQGGTPYKLGMFEQNGRQFVGLVLNNDTAVVDLSRDQPQLLPGANLISGRFMVA